MGSSGRISLRRCRSQVPGSWGDTRRAGPFAEEPWLGQVGNEVWTKTVGRCIEEIDTASGGIPHEIFLDEGSTKHRTFAIARGSLDGRNGEFGTEFETRSEMGFQVWAQEGK